MAARSLKHYPVVLSTGGNVDTTAVAAPGAGRALVISKITVTAANSAIVFSLRIGTGYVAEKVALAIGEVYTESGLVQLPGETIGYSVDVGAAGSLNVFGEEVDN